MSPATKQTNRLVEIISNVGNFLAHRKGLPVFIGAGLVLFNLILRWLPEWPFIVFLVQDDFFLHLGVIIGLLGILLGDAL